MRPTPPDIDTDLIIIGAGVSGIKLASLLADTDKNFWLLGSPFESQLAKAGYLENSTLPEGTVGLKFIEEEFNRLKEKNISHRSSLCTGIEEIETGYKVYTKFQNFTTQSIVIATGKKQKSLGFDGEKEWFHKGISDCTVCDFPLYRDRPVAVVGDHEYTIRAARLMKKHTSPVSLLWLGQDAPSLDGITVYNSVSNLRAEGEEVLQKVTFDHSEGTEILQIHGLFVEGQPIADPHFISPLELVLNSGEIVVNDRFETSKPDIWAIGDITGKSKSYDEAIMHAEELFQFLQ